MTTLTTFQNALTETIWTQLEDANEGRGSLIAAMLDRIGTLGDFFLRYFAEDQDVKMVLFTLITVTDKLNKDFDSLTEAACQINIFDQIDSAVREADGNDDDANAVQNMISEQHWVALTTELRYLAQTNNDNKEINALADLVEAANKYLLNALYA